MPERSTYVLTRFVMLRLLALVYGVAFLCLVLQLRRARARGARGSSR